MRSRYLVFLVVMFLAAVLALPNLIGPDSVAQGSTPDDEIVFIDASSFLQVRDPVAPPGQQAFTWSSQVGGWTDLTVLDSNADGVDEILSIGANTARLWNPQAPGGAPAPPSCKRSPAALCICLSQRAISSPAIAAMMKSSCSAPTIAAISAYSVQIYDGDADGTQWTLVFDELYGVPWLRLATGPYNDLARDELVMVRNGLAPSQLDYRIKIISRTPDNLSWGTVADKSYTFPWIDLAVGNVNPSNPGDMAELVMTHDDVLGSFASILVFWYAPPNPIADAPNGQRTAFPPFFDIALGDVNGSGDEEAFLIRDPAGTPSGVSMIGLNWGTDSMPSVWDNPGLQLGRDLKAVTTGDVDGDGMAEVIVAHSGSYFIYWQPGSNITDVSGDFPVSLRNPVIINTGNFDGSGLEPPELAVSTNTLNFQMLAAKRTRPPRRSMSSIRAAAAASSTLPLNWKAGSPSPRSMASPRPRTRSASPGRASPPAPIRLTSRWRRWPMDHRQPAEDTRHADRSSTGPILEVLPESFTYNYNFGGVLPAPADMTIRNIGDGGAKNYTLTIVTDNGVPWIKTDKTSGTTNDVVKVSIAPQGLAPGVYTGHIHIDAGAIEGSPVDIPVTINIEATGMIVTPSELLLLANRGGPSPVGNINVKQAVAGENAIHFYAYAVLSGDWWDTQAKLAGSDYTVAKDGGSSCSPAPRVT